MRTRIWSGVISDLPPNLLLGNAFDSPHVKAIDPKVGFVRLVNTYPAPILATRNELFTPISVPHPLESTSRLCRTLNENNHDNRIAQTRTIASNSQRFIPVTTKVLIFVESRPELLNRYRTTATKGIAETNKSAQLCILVGDFSNQRVTCETHAC